MGQQLRRVGSSFPRLRAHRNGSGERQPSGKVQKFIIREQEIRERGLEEVARIRTA
jgi:hypothetical protein